MRRLIVISGAGLSTESGIPTFRTETTTGKALWQSFDIDEVCNIHSFQQGFHRRKCSDIPVIGGIDKDGMDLYEKTHQFYNKRRQELETIEPNFAHLQIAKWFKDYPHQVLNLSTNVDDLLERAGVPKEDTLYIHGYLKEILVKDAFTQKVEVVNIGYDQIDPDDYDWCKPNVIFFGENAPAYNQLYETLDNLTNQDMVIVVGCSNTVINFNWELFPAVRRGTKVIVVNPNINYLEQEQYEINGVLQFRCGAVEAFSNKNFIRIVENHLEGKTSLQSKD